MTIKIFIRVLKLILRFEFYKSHDENFENRKVMQRKTTRWGKYAGSQKGEPEVHPANSQKN